MKIKWFYKGFQVHKWYRHVLYYFILGVSTVPFFVLITGKFVVYGLHGFRWSYFINSIWQGILISMLFIVCCIPLLLFLYHMQKLCNMVYNAVYFNLEGAERNGYVMSYKKQMTYFPKFYYRRKKDCCEITIKLDGSKYQKNFLELDAILEDLFDMEVIDKRHRYWYLVYTLSNFRSQQLTIENAPVLCGSRIPVTKILAWDYTKAPHALITGGTGGGKTYFLLYLFRYLLNSAADIWIIDPKRADFYSFRKVLGDDRVASEAGGVLPMLRKIKQLMEDRYTYMSGRKEYEIGADYRTFFFHPVFLIFDEFIAFIDSLKREDKEKAMDILRQITLKGRQSGVFLILATQRADAAYLTGALRDNLGLRVSLGSLEKEGYRMTFGTTDKELEKKSAGYGYIWIDGVTTTVREFAAPYIPKEFKFYEDVKRIVQERETN